MKTKTKKIMKTGAGILAILGGLALGSKYIVKNHNPSYYVVEGDSRKDFSKLEQKLVEEPAVTGEKNIPMFVASSTIDEFREEFKEYYSNNFNKIPENGTVTQDQLVKFVNSYVGEKLSFRWPVLFPQKIVSGIRLLPYGKDVMPVKQHEYFHKLNIIDVADLRKSYDHLEKQEERMTDCWDYAQLFKTTFNILSSDYAVGSEAYRIFGKTYFLGMKTGSHDFNAVIDATGNKVYVDSNAQDTPLIGNPLYMGHKVREINPLKNKKLINHSEMQRMNEINEAALKGKVNNYKTFRGM